MIWELGGLEGRARVTLYNRTKGVFERIDRWIKADTHLAFWDCLEGRSVEALVYMYMRHLEVLLYIV